MTRWQRGVAEIERMLADGELQALTGAAADGGQWLAKARRTLSTATDAAGTDPDSAFTLAYDAARFACTALLAQQGLRVTTRGGHYAVEVAVRSQFGGTFDQYGGLRRQRNDIEYPVIIAARLTPDDAQGAIGVANELIGAAGPTPPASRPLRLDAAVSEWQDFVSAAGRSRKRTLLQERRAFGRASGTVPVGGPATWEWPPSSKRLLGTLAAQAPHGCPT
jgi:hypothetical protein